MGRELGSYLVSCAVGGGQTFLFGKILDVHWDVRKQTPSFTQNRSPRALIYLFKASMNTLHFVD